MENDFRDSGDDNAFEYDESFETYDQNGKTDEEESESSRSRRKHNVSIEGRNNENNGSSFDLSTDPSGTEQYDDDKIEINEIPEFNYHYDNDSSFQVRSSNEEQQIGEVDSSPHPNESQSGHEEENHHQHHQNIKTLPTTEEEEEEDTIYLLEPILYITRNFVSFFSGCSFTVLMTGLVIFPCFPLLSICLIFFGCLTSVFLGCSLPFILNEIEKEEEEGVQEEKKVFDDKEKGGEEILIEDKELKLIEMGLATCFIWMIVFCCACACWCWLVFFILLIITLC